MTTDSITYLCDLLESGGDIPAPSREWLLGALRQIDQGHDPREALGLPEPNADSRNQVLRQNAISLPGTPWRKAGMIADQARRIHRGRKSSMPWILAADRLRPLPETQRQIFNILKTRM